MDMDETGKGNLKAIWHTAAYNLNDNRFLPHSRVDVTVNSRQGRLRKTSCSVECLCKAKRGRSSSTWQLSGESSR